MAKPGSMIEMAANKAKEKGASIFGNILGAEKAQAQHPTAQRYAAEGAVFSYPLANGKVEFKVRLGIVDRATKDIVVVLDGADVGAAKVAMEKYKKIDPQISEIINRFIVDTYPYEQAMKRDPSIRFDVEGNPRISKGVPLALLPIRLDLANQEAGIVNPNSKLAKMYPATSHLHKPGPTRRVDYIGDYIPVSPLDEKGDWYEGTFLKTLREFK